MTTACKVYARACSIALCGLGLMVMSVPRAQAEVEPKSGIGDPRVRVAAFKTEEVYRLRGFVGFQIDLEFENGGNLRRDGGGRY